MYVDEISADEKGLIVRVAQFLEREQWPEAADMLVRLSESDLNKLVELQEGSASSTFATRFLPLRSVIHRWVGQLASLAPETLAAHRVRVDSIARQRLSDAVARRDRDQLEHMLDDAFHSSHGDDALLLLGDWAMERGDFGEARRCFRAIHAGLAWHIGPTKLPLWIRRQRGEGVASMAKELVGSVSRDAEQDTYVGSEIPLEQVWARLILVSILAGDTVRANAELAIFSEAWPAARGTVGGRKGRLKDLLAQQLAESRGWPIAEPPPGWSTFAGNSSRNAQLNLEIDIPMKPIWRQPLPALDSAEQFQQRALRYRFGLPLEASGELAERPCRFFPIVVGGRVFYRDQDGVYCLDLKNGEPAWSSNQDGRFYELGQMVRPPTAPALGSLISTPQLGQHRFTLSSAQGLITTTLVSNSAAGAPNSTLIGFDLSRQGAIKLGPVPTDSSKWTFHGAPIHDGDRCWVGIRLHDASAQDFLACYDVQTGRQIWQTRICTADILGSGTIEFTCNFLLTKNEDTVYVSSHLGVIAAVSARSGRIRWASKYSRVGPRTQNLTDQSWHALRELTPCVVHDDLLFVAPADSNCVFALHKDTGTLLWSTPIAADATNILGVTDEQQLILSGRRLWWLDVYTGQPSAKVGVNPFPSEVIGEPSAGGRALLSAGKIYLPAVENESSLIYVLDQVSGRPLRQPIDLETRGVEAGNLVAVPSYLLIAGPEELAVFSLK